MNSRQVHPSATLEEPLAWQSSGPIKGRQMSMGEGLDLYYGIAVELALRHPALVRKLVLASLAQSPDGVHPEIVEPIEDKKFEDLAGSAFEQAWILSAFLDATASTAN
jgi:pimeloyl-ACP methyl ester carboxylesterase